MTLRIEDRWVWDFWLAETAGVHHVFYLQASRSLGDPELRHWNVSIGHATSSDLVHWDLQPDAFAPAPEPAWDDYTTWTGSIIEARGTWWCFYTGSSRAERGLVQRIGAATSPDLTTWTRHPGNPLVRQPDHTYERLASGAWKEQAWRDPYVVALDGRYHVLLTARSDTGPADGRGVVAHGVSDDLEHWEVGAPIEVLPHGQFGHLEVPQIVPLDGRWYLLFCTGHETHAAAWEARTGGTPRTGTYYAVGDHPLGPYRIVDDEPLGPADGGISYSGKVVLTASGPVYLGWRMTDAGGAFVGELENPCPVRVDGDGRLRLDPPLGGTGAPGGG